MPRGRPHPPFDPAPVRTLQRQGLTQKQIADRLGRSEGYVYARAERGFYNLSENGKSVKERLMANARKSRRMKAYKDGEMFSGVAASDRRTSKTDKIASRMEKVVAFDRLMQAGQYQEAFEYASVNDLPLLKKQAEKELR